MMNKLRICYNNCLRRLMNIPKLCSASHMFVYLNVPSFAEILRRNIYSFIMRLNNSYLAPGGGCEVLFSPGLSVCLSVCVCVCLCICVSGQYFGILFLGY